ILRLPPGTVIDYWLEATDCADFPNPAGNVGKSPVYKITLTAAPKNSRPQQAKRDSALQKQKEHNKKQDDGLAQSSSKPGSGPGSNDPQKQVADAKKEKEKTEQAVKDQLDTQKKGEGKA